MLPFEKALEKLELTNFDKAAASPKKLDRAFIEKLDTERFNLPVFSVFGKNPPKGIYNSFDDFLKNRADLRPFEVNFGKRTDQLYIIENGESKLLTGFWGFCDGINFYYNSGFNFYKLSLVNHCFEFTAGIQPLSYPASLPSYVSAYPSSQRTHANGLISLGIMNLLSPGSNKSDRVAKPFQIDMETGEPY